MIINIDELLRLLKEYEEARQYDADCGEADNSGNVVGDKLADRLREMLNEPTGNCSN